MKFKTRLMVTFITIIALPLVLTAIAFIIIGVYLMNVQQGYTTIPALDYSMISESFQTYAQTADSAYTVLYNKLIY